MFTISIVMIFILWTWELTPLWVNIVGTIMLSLTAIKELEEGSYEKNNEEN